MPADEWLGMLGGDTDSFTSMIGAFHGIVKVFPWYIVLKNNDDKVGPLTEETHIKLRQAMPGLWVDLAGSHYTGRIREFADFLEANGGIGPTIITGRDMDGMLDHFDQGRLWWRVEWGTAFPAYRDQESKHIRAAWGMHIQQLARQFGLCDGLPVCGNPLFQDELYDLPGTSGVSTVVWTGYEPITYNKIDWATYNRLAESKAMREEFTTLEDRRALGDPPLWDDVLKPLGWHSLGMGETARMTWWSAPGCLGEPTAYTLLDRLYLRTPNWLSGLKEASDAGIRLNMWTVACILGWDSDIRTFQRHWIETRTLY